MHVWKQITPKISLRQVHNLAWKSDTGFFGLKSKRGYTAKNNSRSVPEFHARNWPVPTRSWIFCIFCTRPFILETYSTPISSLITYIIGFIFSYGSVTPAMFQNNVKPERTYIIKLLQHLFNNFQIQSRFR